MRHIKQCPTLYNYQRINGTCAKNDTALQMNFHPTYMFHINDVFINTALLNLNVVSKNINFTGEKFL